MAKRDYYEILGVSRSATTEEIKQAYRRLALQYHPDRNPGNKEAEERFKEIAEAYQVLSDPQRRAAYDQFGHSMRPGAEDFEGFRDARDLFAELFRDFFGEGGIFGEFFGRAHRPRPRSGEDLRYHLEISFEEAAFGTEVEIQVPRHQTCPRCGGRGMEPGTHPVACPACGGRGEIRFRHGFLNISQTCTRCQGTGMVIKHPCRQCGGEGRVRGTRTLRVRVPPGVDTGARLRIPGEGEPGMYGGPPGDLYVVVRVREHPLFERRGDDIVCEVPIGFPQAALGAEVEVPTLEGPVKLTVPPGTQSGEVIRLRGRGFPRFRGRGRGDQLVVIRVETPTNLTPRQRELLEEFARLSGEDTTPRRKSFLEKLRELFGSKGTA